MVGLSFTGLIILVLIIFIISYNLHIEPFLDTIDEPFATDISNNKTYSNRIIYDTIPYGSSSLFYDYVYGLPYYYNPLDYWLNPYYYYSLYNPSYTTSYTTSNSGPYVKKVRHIKITTRRFH